MSDTKDKNILKHVPAGIKQGKELLINKDELPLPIIYKGKRYILILTKNDKLILNKYTD